jgi:hypothetical protein
MKETNNTHKAENKVIYNMSNNNLNNLNNNNNNNNYLLVYVVNSTAKRLHASCNMTIRRSITTWARVK